MRKNDTQMKKSELLPFHIIKAASEGDVEAINTVLKHYEGQVHYCVDETLRRRLETKLITKILAFKPVPYETGKVGNRQQKSKLF